jgi:DNA-binding NtrC family response regulator
MMAQATVLLVDDDDGIRFSLAKILELHDFEVSTAANVSDALRLIGTTTFDVLLSDLHMPGPGRQCDAPLQSKSRHLAAERFSGHDGSRERYSSAD